MKKFLIILLIGLGIYLPTLKTDWDFDAVKIVKENYCLRDMGCIRKDLVGNSRLFTYITYYLNFRVLGESVWGFRLVNIILHCIVAFLVYLLLTRLEIEKSKAFLLGIIFLVAPINTSMVFGVVQRFTILATSFYISAFLVVISRKKLGKYWWIYLSILLLLGIQSKEIMITWPLAFLWYGMVFYKWKIRFNKWFLTGILVAVSIFMGMQRFYSLKYVFGEKISSSNEVINSTNYLLTQLSILPRYLGLLVLPVKQFIDYQIPVVNVINIGVFLGIVLYLGLWSLAFKLRIKNSLVSMGIGWILISMLVEGSIIPIEDVMFEHRLYLPMVGFVLILAGLIKNIKIIWGIILIYLVMSILRMNVLKSPVKAWEQVVNEFPKHSRGYVNWGYWLYKDGQTDKSMKAYEKALMVNKNNTTALYNLAMMKKDEELVLKLLGINKNDYDAQALYLDLLTEKGDWETAYQTIGGFWKGKKVSSERANTLGVVCAKLGKFEEAYDFFQIAVEADINNQNALNNFNMAKNLLGR